MALQTPTLLLVDGHSLAYRSFYAFAYSREGGLRTSTGIPTSVSFGFLKSLLEVLDKHTPTHVAVAFDTRQPTFRHEADETYKAGRPETPPEFIEDVENLKQLLTALRIPILMAPGFEADDILGTLSTASAKDYKVQILSGDQDLFQLIDNDGKIRVLHLNNKDRISEFGPEQVKEKLGIWPWQVVDYKALCGDSSDNIPGVKGIGPKRAVELLERYGSLTEIFKHIPEIKGKVQQYLQEGIQAAQHSQFMAQIKMDVPLPLDWESMRLTGFDQEELIPLLEKLEFQSFINQVRKIQASLGGIQAELGDPSEGNSSTDSEKIVDNDEALWFDFALAPTRTLPAVWIVDTPEKLAIWVQDLLACEGIVAWDTETTSLDPRDAQLVGIGCCWSEQDIAYLPIAHSSGTNLNWELVKSALQPIWEDPQRPKSLQNCKYDLSVLRAQGIRLRGIQFDPMLASYVLDPEASHNLGDLAATYLNLPTTRYQDLVGKKGSIADISIPQVAEYCGSDAYCAYQLVPILTEKLQQTGPRLWDLFTQVELPLALILEEMEWLGIRIDTEFLRQLSQELQAELEALENTAYTQAGETFNLNSPKQLGSLLFEKLKLDIRKTRKTATGYSTDASVLEKLEGDHPLIATILQHRTLAKLKSTYVDALPALVRNDTGRVHTDFNQTVTATGRLSSSNPNLQNIPIRTEFSRRIRQAFIPQAGWLLAAADYSQIELRILAHLSQEPTLVQGFQSGEDVHILTARLLLDKSEVTSEERRLAKTINYGVIYGMGAQRFARTAGVSLSEAKQFLERFNERYAGIFTYMRSTEAFVEEYGYVETILGRRRYFPNLSRLTGYRKQAELRAAINAPIQGSASDIIKVAMVHLQKKLQQFQSRLLLQVHDELVFEVEPSEWQELQPLIRSEMEGALPLSVPLTVDLQIGQNWKEAK
ncbi:DNA polymerase I [Synechococcus sp. Nb3U1]|uniref:DNA polymerase I n=1 Tax=Synechococcus sp. Nb3U1 TaxID=1914529 RepID=UPI001F490F31|nr:DNA polymerase I [Synechococcus sp. Nb3U1]MCF2971685.1 DNA polymerase I [Synechococcus sp. Nb3U1]